MLCRASFAGSRYVVLVCCAGRLYAVLGVLGCVGLGLCAVLECFVCFRVFCTVLREIMCCSGLCWVVGVMCCFKVFCAVLGGDVLECYVPFK